MHTLPGIMLSAGRDGLSCAEAPTLGKNTDYQTLAQLISGWIAAGKSESQFPYPVLCV